MPPPNPHSTTVITPSMTASRVAGLLESMSRQTVEVEMIVVDNGSPGAEVSGACSEFEFASLLHLDRNAGFSKAVNIAARQAQGDVIVLVNDDVVCDPDFVEAISNAVDPASGTMMAAGVMRDAGDPELIETAGIVIDHTLLAFDYLNGAEISVLDNEVAAPFGPSGAAAAYWREAFLEEGGFDESIFAYLEDVDLAIRLRGRGFRCALADGARGTHEHSSTLGSGSTQKNYLMGFGRGYLLRKWSVLSPRRIPAIIARELPVCLGQLVIDRNFQGVRGRVAGLRSASRTEAYPALALESSPKQGLGHSLRKRLERRHRLRS